MNQINKGLRIKVLTSRIPKWMVCPSCQIRQPFRKKQIRWRKVREMDVEHPTLLKVRIIRACCLNRNCQRDSFTLPIKGIKAYARATERLKEEAIAGIINKTPLCLASLKEYGTVLIPLAQSQQSIVGNRTRLLNIVSKISLPK